MCEGEDEMSMSRESLVNLARLLATELTTFADRAEGARTSLPAVHELLHEAVRVFSGVGVIVEATGPRLMGAWREEQRRIATIAQQN